MDYKDYPLIKGQMCIAYLRSLSEYCGTHKNCTSCELFHDGRCLLAVSPSYWDFSGMTDEEKTALGKGLIQVERDVR